VAVAVPLAFRTWFCKPEAIRCRAVMRHAGISNLHADAPHVTERDGAAQRIRRSDGSVSSSQANGTRRKASFSLEDSRIHPANTDFLSNLFGRRNRAR